jgi:hypothetical protein
LNTSDAILYTSGTTSNSILPIGWDRISRTGDTMTGTLYTPNLISNNFSGVSLNTIDYIIFNTGTQVLRQLLVQFILIIKKSFIV